MGALKGFCCLHRSWYILFFQCPWLPEFLVTAADQKFLNDAFKDGKVAPRTPGAVTDEDIERWVSYPSALFVVNSIIPESLTAL